MSEEKLPEERNKVVPIEDPDAERKEKFPTILGVLLAWSRGSGSGAKLRVRQMDDTIVEFRQGYLDAQKVKRFTKKACVIQLVWRENEEYKIHGYYGRAIIPVHPHEFAKLKNEIEPLLFDQSQLEP